MAVDGNAITYDAIGNPLSYYNGYTMTWDKGRQLTTLNTPSKTYTYGYDAGGSRISRTCSDGTYVKYHVLNGVALGETRYKADGSVSYTMRYTFDERGEVCGFCYKGSTATAWTHVYFVKNLQGDVIQVYAYGGKLMAHL